MIARRRPVFLPVLICLLSGLVSPLFVGTAFGQATQPTDNSNPDATTDDVGPDNGAGNPDNDDGDGGTNDDPVWGYFLGKSAYIFFHELARHLTAQNGEAIADTPAKRDELTVLLLTAEGQKHFGGTALSTAVAGWIVSWRQAQQDEPTSPGPDEEKPDTWDTENITPPQLSDLLCALYGSAPSHFHTLIDSGDIKVATAETCVTGYRELTKKWAAMLPPTGVSLAMPKGEAGPLSPDNGASPNAMPTPVASGTGALSLEQQPSTAAELADFTNWLRDVALFDNLTTELNRDLGLPASLKITLLQCGANTSAAEDKAGNMSLCFEWLKPGYDAATAQNVEAPPE